MSALSEPGDTNDITAMHCVVVRLPYVSRAVVFAFAM
jgi:hypothetical protein